MTSTEAFHIIIPARLASTRLPNKPMADINGLPMIVRVAKQASLSQAATVTVAADDAQILQTCAQHGIQAVLTDKTHASGSDRLAQAGQLLGFTDDTVIVNVQGDEPLIEPSLINHTAELMYNPRCLQTNGAKTNTHHANAPHAVPSFAEMGTACHAIENTADFFNPNVVKVVLNNHCHALYFSRSPIAYPRDAMQNHKKISVCNNEEAILPQKEDATSHSNTLNFDNFDNFVYKPLRHIGIYSYRFGFLKTFTHLAVSALEQTESLEQLRVLAHGYSIAVHISPVPSALGIDTPEDLERVRSLLKA